MTEVRSLSTPRQNALRAGLMTLATACVLLGLAALQPSHGDTRAGACEVTPVSLTTTATAEPATVRVTVENVRSSSGLITAILYPDNPKTFLKEGKRLDKVRVEAREGETVLCLKAPSTGRYSVALYHDENGNKDFDQNFLGIPTEGYGFSNNPGFRFGKPEQEETLFTIEESLTDLRISVLYL